MFEVGQQVRLTKEAFHEHAGARATIHEYSQGEIVQVKEKTVQVQFRGICGLTVEVPTGDVQALP